MNGSAAKAARARIGITDFAQDQLGDIVYVELPAVGQILHDGRTLRQAWNR